MKIDPNDPAFPADRKTIAGPSQYPGMSVRTWLAGMAMQGICHGALNTTLNIDDVACIARKQADALIAALNTEQPNG